MTRDSQFSLYKITNGHILFDGEEQAKKLGCTGELEVESEIKKVTKVCEGVPVQEAPRVTKMKLKFVGHVEKNVLVDIFGLNSDKLKTGVRGYGELSKGKKCTLTWDAYDLFETDTLLLAYPNVTIADGLKYKIKNGEDEVAEIDIEFTALKDEYGYIYYEAFGSEATEVKENWHKKFESKNVQKNSI